VLFAALGGALGVDLLFIIVLVTFLGEAFCMRLFLTSILRVGVLESRFGEEIHTQKVFHNHIFCNCCPSFSLSCNCYFLIGVDGEQIGAGRLDA
jgi:hypothetical protein